MKSAQLEKFSNLTTTQEVSVPTLVLFVDPTGRDITLDDNPVFIDHPEFQAYFYAEKSFLKAFEEGELKRFGFQTWIEVKKSLRPARLAKAVIKFIKKNQNLPDDTSLLNKLYSSPISLDFPNTKPFFCFTDGYTYSGENEYNWFITTSRSPTNRNWVNPKKDLNYDSLVETILRAHHSEIRDLR